MKTARVAERSDSLFALLIDNIDVPTGFGGARFIDESTVDQALISTNVLSTKNYELFEVRSVSVFLQYFANVDSEVLTDAHLTARIQFKDNVEGAGFLDVAGRIGVMSSLDLSHSPILLRNVDGIKVDTDARLYIPPHGVVYNSLADEIQTVYPTSMAALFDAKIYFYGKWVDIGGL